MTERTRPSTVGVVLAAGLGTRVGAQTNKAYLRLAGRSMVSWSLDAMNQLPEIARTVLVFRRGEREHAARDVQRESPGAEIELVAGGDSRHTSESNVLDYLAADIDAGQIDVVLIHDAARPLAGSPMMRTALRLARQFGGAVPALPAPGVLQTGPGGALRAVDNVGTLVRVQTPQAFRAEPLLAAYRAAHRAGFEGTDTSSCVEQFTDIDIRTYPGTAHNLKVTYAPDVALAEHLLLTPDTSPRAESR